MIRKAVVTPTITAGAYSSLDAVGGLMEFEDVCTPYSNTGHVTRVTISDKGKQNAKLYLVLFDQTFTATADNAAFDPSDSDLGNIVDVVLVNSWVSFNDNSVGQPAFDQLDVDVPFELVEGGTSLFGQLMVDTSTPTYTSTSDLIVTLIVET